MSDPKNPAFVNVGSSAIPAYVDSIHTAPRADGSVVVTLLSNVPASGNPEEPPVALVAGRFVVSLPMLRIMSDILTGTLQKLDALSADTSKAN